MRAVGVLGLLVGTVGCMGGSFTLWRGKTSDRRHCVEIVERSGKQNVRIDGQEGSAFDAVAPGSLCFSPDGRHLAFAVREQGAWHVVHDGRMGPGWDGVSEVLLSPAGDDLAYGAERADGWHVVRGEQPGPAFDGLLSGTLSFSVDGRHLVYAALTGAKSRVVIDGSAGPALDGVGQLQLSDDGAHVAYAARLGDTGFVMFDGGASGPWDAVQTVVVGRLGRLAYIARRAGAFWCASSRLDGPSLAEDGPYRTASGLALSTDEQHVAWVSRLFDEDAVVVDGQPAPGRYASIAATSLAFRPKRSELAFAARDVSGQFRVRIGNLAGAPFDEILGPAISFSEDGRRAGYTGRRGSSFVVVLDGVEQPAESWAGRPVFDAQGTRSGYLVRRQQRTVAIVDGVAHDLDVGIEGTLAFSKDGRHWSCLVGSSSDHNLHFVVDAELARRLDFDELVSASEAGSVRNIARGSGDILRAWAAAEAELGAPSAFDESKRCPAPNR